MKILNFKKIKLLYVNLIAVAILIPSFSSALLSASGGSWGGLYAQTINNLLYSEWTLHDAEVNGTSLPLSILGAFLYPDDFGVYSFEFYYGTPTCYESFKVNFTDVTGTSFNLSTINEYLSCNYTNPDEIAAVELYLSFYFELPFDTNSTPKNPFTYEWVDNHPFVDRLKIINPQGDWLMYQTYTLSTPDFDINSFTLYANPVSETLYINNGSNQAVIATIYGINGKQLQKHSLETGDGTIDVKTLNPGLYFVVFESEAGERVSKKFIKK